MSMEPMQVNEASPRYLAQGEVHDVPPGYKRTEVGVIPEDWKVVTLSELGTFLKGKGIKRDDVTDEGVPCIRYGEIYTRYNDYVTDAVSRISESVALTSQPLKTGDLLFAGSGETAEEIGKCVAYLGEDLAYAGGDIVILRPVDEDSLYLSHLLNHGIVVQQKARFGQGDAVVHISARNLAMVNIPLPILTEQRAIAEALSDVDGLLGALEALIAKKRAIEQAAMQQLLTGLTRLPGFSGEWETKRLGEILRFQVGCPFSSKHFTSEELGLRLVKNRDLKADDEIVYYNGPYADDYLVSDGDVLIGMDGDFLPCLWSKGEALLNQRVGRLRATNDLDIKFAYYFLREPLKEIERATSSTTVKHLSHGDVESIIGLIPRADEQTAIATVLSDMDSEIAALEARRVKTRALKQGMMHQLLTGSVRLVKTKHEGAATC